MQYLFRPSRGKRISTTNLPFARRQQQSHLLSSSCCRDGRLLLKTTCRSNSTQSAVSSKVNHTAYVRSALSAGLVPYEKGWAWQHMLLSRRLNYIRMKEKLDALGKKGGHDDDDADQQHPLHGHDKDWILLFEHQPVYTLGRGATEDNLTFLDNEPDGGMEKRKRLSRKYRGEDASRLNIDRIQKQNMSFTNDDSATEQEEVDELSNKSMCISQPVLAPNGSPIYRIERGGEVTFHGPGQLVMYPLLNLKNPNYQQDLHWYLRNIEEVIIQTLLHFDIQSNRDAINTGVFVGQNKIAAVGVSASKWITTHGLALNVNPNLDNFDKDISIPCGLKDRGVTSISDVMGVSYCPSLIEVADVALKCFAHVFDVEVVEDSPIR